MLTTIESICLIISALSRIIWYHIKHYIYLLMYALFLISACLNLVFPIYLLKFLNIYKKQCTSIITLILYKLQSALTTILITVGDTKIWIYEKKNKKINKENFERSIVTISNHVSQIDPLYMGALFNHIYPSKYQNVVFSKHGVRFYPFIGWLIIANDAIFVFNDNKKPNLNQYNYIKNKLKNNASTNKNILIFMEGSAFNENIKKRREEHEIYKDLHYNNILIPKTTGLHLIESTCDISKELHVTMKYDHCKCKGWTCGINKMLKGLKPESVHMFIEEVDVQKDPKNRQNFDKMIYDDFKIIDKRLDSNIFEWGEHYDRYKIPLDSQKISSFIIYLLLGIYTVYKLITSWSYIVYALIVIIFFSFRAYIEHNDIKK